MHIRLLAAALVLATADAGAQIVTNGSFEQSPIPSGSMPPYAQIGAGSPALPGWTIGGSLDYVGSYWQAADGDRSLDMSGASLGRIHQDLALTVGTRYRLSFAMAGNGLGEKTLHLYLGAPGTFFVDPTAVFTYAYPGATFSYGDMRWQTRTFEFVATAATTRLAFQSYTAGSAGAALDAVSVAPISAVPEPATAALLGGGLALLGVAAHRRRQDARRAA